MRKVSDTPSQTLFVVLPLASIHISTLPSIIHPDPKHEDEQSTLNGRVLISIPLLTCKVIYMSPLLQASLWIAECSSLLSIAVINTITKVT